ncbi:MAG: hypothetical protein V1802_02500, partial [Candidatus Aenigmatarchaeota archaeon]
FDQCYGGGFAEEIGKERYIAVASAKPYQGGYGKTNNTFGGYFMLAFRDKNKSDTNEDGRVSIREAFEYAKGRHKWTKKKEQEPIIRGELNPNRVFLK